MKSGETARPKTMPATLAAPTDTLQDIIWRMDWAALEIVLVVNRPGALIGTITDGDIRRGILAGVELHQPAAVIMNRTPIAVPDATPRSEMLDIMRRFSIRHLPVLDGAQRPIRLELREELSEDTLPESAVIMAGGLGQRLRPLTENTPKPLLEVADRPILDHILQSLRRSGVEDVVISLNYLGDRIRRHVGDGRAQDLHVRYVTETQALGTAGALSLLDPTPRQPFLVMNGDLLTNLNVAHLFRYQRKHQHDLVMCVRKHNIEVPYGVVELAREQVVALREKPVYSHLINAGIYLVHPRCLERIPQNKRFDMTDLIRKVIQSGGSVGAFPIIEYWRDIGNPRDFQAANHEKNNVEAARLQPAMAVSMNLAP